MWRKLFFVFVVLAALLFNIPGTLAQEKSYRADRFDVAVQVQNDGSLRVTETVVFSFTGEPFTYVFREIPTSRTDGITILTASVDGRSYPRGTNAGEVEIEEGRNLRVTWHLEPTANVARTFVLQYQVFGVVQQAANVDLLRYQPLPDEFEYSIASSTVTVTYPGSAVLQNTPIVTAGNAQVSQTDRVTTFTRQNISANETLVFEMTFAQGSLISAPPAWQAQQMEQRALAPFWIVSGLVILVAGTIGAFWVWRTYQPQSVKGTAVHYEPPNNLPPAIAGVLNGSSVSPTWPNALATLFDLAESGILTIQELDEKKWYQSRDFHIVLQEKVGNLRPHEQGLLDLLFETKKGRETAVRLSKLSNAISGKQWKKFTDPLEAEIKAAGFIDEERKTRRQWVIGGSVILMILGVVALIAMPIGLADQFGPWPVAIAISLFILFGIWLAMGSSLTILTDEAKIMADEWQSFYQYLKDVTRKKAAVGGTNMFNQFLPYAATYGLLHQWAKFFQKEGWTDLPPYFHAISRSGNDGMAAFVAMTATSSSSGGSAAGAGGAGAGAAGGGASGAG
jgi:hypothetical protein